MSLDLKYAPNPNARDYSKLPPKGELMDVSGRRIPIKSRNIQGSPERDWYDRDGVRKFVVDLLPMEAEAMTAAGWPVLQRAPREDGQPVSPYIVIAVFPDPKPGYQEPMIVLDNGKNPRFIKKSFYHLFDSADIEYADIEFHAYFSKKGNIKIALDKLYVKVIVSNMEAKHPEFLNYSSSDDYVEDYEPAD